uniref:recombinase family protein n=1 Tax=Paractinoplanes polyasparticus TaxID=2856853 RepID=UPI00210748B1|nr:recombinase family protein [Actinoplanes polyasparticus]
MCSRIIRACADGASNWSGRCLASPRSRRSHPARRRHLAAPRRSLSPSLADDARPPIRTRSPTLPDAHHRRDVRPSPRPRTPPRRTSTLWLPAGRRRATPNQAHAAWGRRLHRFAPDPDTAAHVRWIFTRRLAGASTAGIARLLNDRRIPSPAQHDPGRNRHRTNTVWTLRAVAAILANPRYTGRGSMLWPPRIITSFQRPVRYT